MEAAYHSLPERRTLSIELLLSCDTRHSRRKITSVSSPENACYSCSLRAAYRSFASPSPLSASLRMWATVARQCCVASASTCGAGCSSDAGRSPPPLLLLLPPSGDVMLPLVSVLLLLLLAISFWMRSMMPCAVNRVRGESFRVRTFELQGEHLFASFSLFFCLFCLYFCLCFQPQWYTRR